MNKIKILIIFSLMVGAVGGYFIFLSAINPSVALSEVALSDQFVTRNGNDLYVGTQKIRFAGANMSWWGLYGGGTHPTNFEIDDAVSTVKEMGATVIRSFGAQLVGCPACIEPVLDQFNDQGFQSTDYALMSAASSGLKVILPLVDNYHFGNGGKHTFTDWRNLTNEDEFFSNPTVIQDYKNYISHILNHVNPYTGIVYKNDPTIMAWETGNELNNITSPWDPNWTENIASFIKSIDPNHLVMDGHSASFSGNRNLDGSSLSLPSVDIYSGHFYPPSISFMKSGANLAKQYNKAYLVGEYDWTDTSAKQPLVTISQDTSTSTDGTKSAKVNITSVDTTDWHIRLYQQNLNFTANQSYTLSFWAKSSVPRDIRVSIKQTPSPYASYFSQVISLSTSWQNYSFNFNPTVSESNAVIFFNLGAAVSSVWVDDVNFSASSTNQVINNSFENTGASWLSPWVLWVAVNDVSTLSQFLPAIEDPLNNIAGDLYWSFSGHGEVRGFNRYNDPVYTLHYTGDTTDMKNRAQQIRTHGYNISGVAVPGYAIPSAPLLYPITSSSSANLVDWRGTAFADSYSIERSTDGLNWQVIKSGLTDNNSPWSDYQTTGGGNFYYRMRAFNLSGQAEGYSLTQTISLPDTVAPTVVISNPLNNSNVSGVVNISANITDNVAVTHVEFYVDGVLLANDTNNPYSTTWDTTGYTNNTSHTILVKGYDAVGNIGTASNAVSVQDTTPPQVAITNPTNGAVVPRNTTVTIVANASDVSGIAKVEFSVNSSLICTDVLTPFSCNWTVPGKKGTSYTLWAKAYDNAGNTNSNTVGVKSSN